MVRARVQELIEFRFFFIVSVASEFILLFALRKSSAIDSITVYLISIGGLDGKPDLFALYRMTSPNWVFTKYAED